ncbi:MAG: OmpA family protein [Steroidobacteraceae bacterium]|nr:OmpA family protein [Steroidobacteraceae bacterium]
MGSMIAKTAFRRLCSGMRGGALQFAAVGLLTAALAGCSAMPETIEELETARALVPQVEASPRAGVAATYVSDARKSLERANRLSEEGGDVDEVRYEAQIAALNAQIANEKILTAQARDQIEEAKAERQAVLIEAREREAQRRAQQAEQAEAKANEATERAGTLEQELEALRAKPSPRGMVLTLGEVLFDLDQATLKPGAYRTMDRLAKALQHEPDQVVMIEGHTDSTGAEEYNQQLSQRRADAVRTALIERGVRADQIETVGKGEAFPVASNENAAGRQQNRRVEMIFAGAGPQVATDEN